MRQERKNDFTIMIRTQVGTAARIGDGRSRQRRQGCPKGGSHIQFFEHRRQNRISTSYRIKKEV